MWRNPVMFVVEVGAALTTVIAIAEPFVGRAASGGSELAPSFSAGIAIWLWITVIFANLAESVAEGRGKAQAAVAARDPHLDARRAGSATTTRRPIRMPTRATVADVASADLRLGDVVIVEAGRDHPRRRRHHRGHRHRRRVGHHRRVGPGRARARRRPQRRHRRHPRAQRPHRREDHRRSPARRSSTG